MTDKSELLNQLKIDRDTEETQGAKTSSLVLIVACIMSLAIGGAGTYYFLPSKATPEKQFKKSDAASAPTTDVTTTAAVAPAQKAEKTTPLPGEEILNASGYITARRMATVSAEIMGLITDVTVEEGMSVEKGQMLARLDSAVAKANLQYAEAQLQAAHSRLGSIAADLAEAKRVLSRTTELNKADFSTDAQLTSAQAMVESLSATYASNEADIQVAEAEVQRQRERLDDHTIKAPFAGIVTVKNAQPGEIVAPTSAGGGFTRTGICTIVDMASLEIEVDVNEAFIGRVFENQKVRANLDAYPDWEIPAHVIAVIPTADRAKATVKVRIAIDVTDTRILPDMGVKVAFLNG